MKKGIYQKRIMSESMNVIILGVGEVGKNLSRVLSQKGHNVIVIDQNREKLNQILETCDVQTLEGNAADLATLFKAGIRECNVLMAVTDNDEVNMLSCLLAKYLGPVTTVARLKKEFYFEGSKTFYRNKLGIDLIVCPEILTAMEIAYHIEQSGSTTMETLADGHMEVKRIQVEKDFMFRGSVIRETNFPANMLIGAIRREGRMIIPSGEDTILEGDELYIVGATEAMEKIESILGLKKEWWFFTKNQSAVIVGGGRIGRVVARLLALRKINVKLIEEEPKKAQKIAEELEGVLVLNADGTDIQVFQEEHLENSHHFVAASNDDATNVLASLMARDMGIPNIITVVERPGYKRILEKLGLPKVESPRFLTANVILEFIQNKNMLIHPLEKESKAEILELYISDLFPLKGKSLKEIRFPTNTLVACILRGERVFVPKGVDTLEAGDIVIFITLHENLETLRGMFTGL